MTEPRAGWPLKARRSPWWPGVATGSANWQRLFGAAAGTAIVVPADVTQQRQAHDAVEQAVAGLGRLDILVNNAGVMLLGPSLEAPIDEWDRMVALNVQGLLYVTCTSCSLTTAPWPWAVELSTAGSRSGSGGKTPSTSTPSMASGTSAGTCAQFVHASQGWRLVARSWTSLFERPEPARG
jgi:hypothetical protein